MLEGREELLRFRILQDFSENYLNSEYYMKKMARKFTVIVEQGEDGYLISEVVGLPGCHTQAKTHDELIERTKEAISLYLESNGEDSEIKSTFLGIQQVEIEA